MKAREIYNLIQTGNQQDAQQALLETLSLLQELSTAMFEVAYEVKQMSLRDPMGQRSRQWLSEFLELPKVKR
jgi:ribosomal protein L1